MSTIIEGVATKIAENAIEKDAPYLLNPTPQNFSEGYRKLIGYGLAIGLVYQFTLYPIILSIVQFANVFHLDHNQIITLLAALPHFDTATVTLLLANIGWQTAHITHDLLVKRGV
jgi:hypothetical protein